MGVVIRSGNNGHYEMTVDDQGRAHVRADSQKRLTYRSETKGSAFYLSTGFVPITSGAERAIFFFLNTSSNPFCISEIRTCGTENQKWRLLKNPTAGTIVSGATAAFAQNLNLGSGKGFAATAYRATADATFTDGDHFAQQQQGMHSVNDLDGAIIIPEGRSIGLACEVAANDDVCANILGFFGGS